MTSAGTRHVSGTQTYKQAKHPHTYNENKVKLWIPGHISGCQAWELVDKECRAWAAEEVLCDKGMALKSCAQRPSGSVLPEQPGSRSLSPCGGRAPPAKATAMRITCGTLSLSTQWRCPAAPVDSWASSHES